MSSGSGSVTSSSEHCEYSASGRRRRAVNYNVNYMTNVVYEKAAEELIKKVNSRAVKKSTNHGGSTSNLKRKHEASVNFDEMCSYERITRNGERRVMVKKLNIDESLPTASGGFRMFVRLCPDSVLELIRAKIDEENVPIIASINEPEYIAQVLRYAWTRMSDSKRMNWEMEARTEAKKLAMVVADVKCIAAKKTCKESAETREVEDAVLAISSETNGVDEDRGGTTSTAAPTDMEVDDQEEGKKDGMEAIEREVMRELPSMPLCETRFCSSEAIDAREYDNKLSLGIFRCPTCPGKNSIVGALAFQTHLIEDHYTVQFYGCHLCFEAFPSLNGLKRHPCQDFAAYTIGLLTADKKFVLKKVMHTLVCAECNLQMPLTFGSSDVSTKKLINLMRVHNCDRLVSCLVFFAELPIGIEHVTVRGLEIKGSIPISCSICHERFVTVFDIEKHGADHAQPKIKCPLCPRFFFTEIFYRDHLVSHLGDQWSMAPIIESSTLMPPTWMTHGRTKMGSQLERVRGPFFALPPPVDINGEISDAEDVIVARYDLAKNSLKGESSEEKTKKSKGKENERKRKAQKNANSERCIYCKQMAQLLPKCARSDLCTCVRENWLGPSPSQDQLHMTKGVDEVRLLMHSLAQKFSRIGYLYVGSNTHIHDTIKGGIITDSVYYCVKCNALHLGKQNTLRHLRICLQKDVETPDPEKSYDLNDENIALRLTHPMSAPNTRVWCPKCTRTCCSIASLRRHLVADHGLYAPFNPPEGSREIGVIEWRGEVKNLSTLAEATNVKLGLTKDGNFILRPPVKHRSDCRSAAIANGFMPAQSDASAPQSESSAVWAVSSPRVAVSPLLVSERPVVGNSNTATSVSGQAQLAKRKECPVCRMMFDSSQEMARHLVCNHLHFCEMCGAAFTERAPLDAHKKDCSNWPHQCADGEYLPFCGICNFTLSTPKRYFYHIANFHFDRFHFDQATRKLMPMLMWKKLSLSEANRKKGIDSSAGFVPSPSVPQTQPIPPTQLATDSSNVTGGTMAHTNETELPYCFLCEKVFGTERTLREHMNTHEEQWRDCPVCHNNSFMKFPVASHEELLRHVIAKHMHRSDSPQEVTMICSLCCTCIKCDSLDTISVRRTEEQMFRHIVYSCNGVSTCFVCNNGRIIRPDDLKKHRFKAHISIYERFGCSSCRKKFFVQSDFKSHVCNTHVRCSCGDRKEFSEREYEAHFKTHLNQMGDFCLLCNKFLATKQQQSSHMTFHRNISVGTRRMIDLHGKQRSSVKQKQPASEKPDDARPAIQQTLSEKMDVQVMMKVKEENEHDDDVIILDDLDLPTSLPGGSSNMAKQDSEIVSATDSIVAEASGDGVRQQAQSMPVPVNFMANVRIEQDVGNVDQSAPIYEESHEVAPVIDIPMETEEEAISSLLGRLIVEVAGDTEQPDECNVISSAVNTPTSSPPPVSKNANGTMQETMPSEMHENRSIGKKEHRLNTADKQGDTHIIEGQSGNDNEQGSPIAERETTAAGGPVVSKTHDEDTVKQSDLTTKEQNTKVSAEDDDDEIQILDVPQRPEGNEAQCREQCASQKTDGGETQKDEGVVMPAAVKGSSCLKEIIDEGDDDLQVIGIGEGPGIQFVKKREARVRCPHCTSRFMTHAALEVHAGSHRYDAGNTISAVYGVPQDRIVYICRLCCLAYESKTIYDKHMRTHGFLQNCQHCSVVAFNEEQMKQHVPQHAAEGPRLTYVCAFCATTYTSDERVYHHMMHTHGMVVMYFCKNCGIGSTNGRLVYMHISRNECGSQQTAMTQTCKLGIASASMFHYQPANETNYVDAVNQGTLMVVVPSECVHRSFLMPHNEQVMITCPQCYGLMSFNRLQSENPSLITSLPRVLSRGQDDSGAILTQLVQIWRSGAHRKGQRQNQNRQTTAPVRQPQPDATDISSTNTGRSKNANIRAVRHCRVPNSEAQSQHEQSSAGNVAVVPAQQTQQTMLLPVTNVVVQQQSLATPIAIASRTVLSATQNIAQSIDAATTTAADLSNTGRLQQHVMTNIANAQASVSYGNMVQVQLQRSTISSNGITSQTRIVPGSASAVSSADGQYDSVVQIASAHGRGTQQASQQHITLPAQIPSQASNPNISVRIQAAPVQKIHCNERQSSTFNVHSFASNSAVLRASSTVVSSSYMMPQQPNDVIPAEHPHLRAQLAISGASLSTQRNFVSSSPCSSSSVHSGAPDQVEATVPVSEDFIVRNARGELVCTRPECAGIRIEKVASGHVHNLRHNIHNTYFCLECGKAFPYERFAIQHQIEVHHNCRAPTLTLRCPLCPKKPGFESLHALRNHLCSRMEHIGKNLQFPMRWVEWCDLMFATDEARQAHEAEHRLSGSSDCCLICGTSRGFWSSPATAQCPQLEHTYIHAFSIWGMCRECGLCFPNELKKEQFVRHYQQVHWAYETSKCQICDVTMHPHFLQEHALKRHFVVGIKTDRNRVFTVTVSESLLNSYLGFVVPGNAKI